VQDQPANTEQKDQEDGQLDEIIGKHRITFQIKLLFPHRHEIYWFGHCERSDWEPYPMGKQSETIKDINPRQIASSLRSSQ
jgi:hypothetical protein